MKKGFIIGFIVAAFLFGGITYAAEYVIKDNSFPIFVNGTQNDNIKALNIDGFTWIQLASLGETGLEVKFNETLKRIEVTSQIPTVSKGGTAMDNTPVATEPKPVPLNRYNMPDFTMYSGRPKIEDDGVNTFFTYNDVKYIGLKLRQDAQQYYQVHMVSIL